jgi:hypothetical protein
MGEGKNPLAHTQDLDVAFQPAVRAFDIERFKNLRDAKTVNQLAVRGFTTDKFLRLQKCCLRAERRSNSSRPATVASASFNSRETYVSSLFRHMRVR